MRDCANVVLSTCDYVEWDWENYVNPILLGTDFEYIAEFNFRFLVPFLLSQLRFVVGWYADFALTAITINTEPPVASFTDMV